MILTKLMIVNRPIRLILRIRPLGPTIIRQARGNTNPRPSQQQRLPIPPVDRRRPAQVRSRGRQRGQEKVDQGSDGAGCGARAGGDYLGEWQGVGVGHAEDRHCVRGLG
jgi:hypothetical protein